MFEFQALEWFCFFLVDLLLLNVELGRGIDVCVV